MINVENFMNSITATKKGSFDFKKGRALEKIALNFEGNHGRYQLLTMNDKVTCSPFYRLPKTYEICIPRTIKSADGNESVINSWIRILPFEGYKMQDQTGRVVSSLTAEEERLLATARQTFDELYTEMDVKNNIDISKNLIRKRNYTLFHGYCINRWGLQDIRTPNRSNFSGLFVCTASGLCEAVQNNLDEKAVYSMGEVTVEDIIKKVYDDKLEGREGFVSLAISKSQNTAGYSVTVSHEWGDRVTNMLSNVKIPTEDAELMTNIVEEFLGWQANREDENVKPENRRLFNSNLIEEAITYMSTKLAAIRMAKANGMSIEDAINSTNDLALGSENNQPTTNDPMLKPQDSGINEDLIKQNNTDPMSTPPATHIDPVTSSTAFTNNSNNGFTQPGWSGWNGGNQKTEGDLPF